MSKRLMILIALVTLSASIYAQNRVRVNLSSNKINGRERVQSLPSGIRIQEKFSHIDFEEKQAGEGSYLQLFSEGMTRSYDQGKPNLPLITRLIEIPLNKKAIVKIIGYNEEIIHLSEYGLVNEIIPAQASVSKSDDPDKIPFVKDRDLYQRDAFFKNELVKFEDKGYLRDKHLGYIEISPFEYNPISNELKVLNDIEIEISFVDDYMAKAVSTKQLASPYFSNMSLNTINSANESKALIEGPVKYVIVSDPMFEETLQPFIEWKTLKGFNVIEAYTNQAEVGNTTTSIKAYLKDLYDNPADGISPTFVLFVGDIAQVPSFPGNTGSHVTDLYYCEYTGDKLPEVFYGRFSATSVAELQPQIDKTLEVEKYEMPDPSYLNNVVLVAGVDAGFAPTHANGFVNYANEFYTNTANGISSLSYLYPASGSSDAQIKADISAGAAIANYTAHCNSNGWADPTFVNSDVASMTNTHMYPLMIGNCCLSNKFDDASCFGETLLRAVDKGAVGYIGGSNNTLWDEDYYWGIGLTSTITANPTYEESELGAYDRFFHSNGEAKEDWYITQGQIIVAGNLAVEASSSSSKAYYWEIYHLMGDPSLTPYVTIPQTLTSSYNPETVIGTSSFEITTEEDAYAALSFNGELLDAKLADETGIAVLTFDALSLAGDAILVITKQNRQPHIDTIIVKSGNTPFIAFDSFVINDAITNANGQADFGEEIKLDVNLKNFSDNHDAFLTNATLRTSDTSITLIDSTETYGTILKSETKLIEEAFSMHIDPAVLNKQKVEFDLIITGQDAGGTDYDWISKLELTVYAPEINASGLIINDSLGNNNQIFDPGETVKLGLVVSNSGGSDIENIQITASQITENSYFELLDTEQNNISLQANSSDTIEFTATVHEKELTGNSVQIRFYVNDLLYNLHNDSIIHEIVIGEMEEYKISDTSSVIVETQVLFYDKGGANNSYGNNENYVITFYPKNPRGKLMVDFSTFDVELNSSGGCYDYLTVYDGDSVKNDYLVGEFCNQERPTQITATNELGALTFKFYSDVSVTGLGWDAIVRNTGHLVKFVISDSEGVLENAIVEFNNEEKYTNTDGVVSFNYVTSGNDLPFVVRRQGFENYTNNISIANDTTVQISLTSGTASYYVDFTITDGRVPIENAQIDFLGLTAYTDENGQYRFNDVLESIDQPYTISKDGYQDQNGTLSVSTNLDVEIKLGLLKYNVSFSVVDDSKDPLEGVKVTLNSIHDYTDALGYVSFTDIMPAKGIVYSLSKEGYNDVDSTVDVENNDTTIQIKMSINTGLNILTEKDIKIYPNPTKGIISVEITNSDFDSFIIKVYDVIGSMVYQKEITGFNQLKQTIDITEKSKGIYFLSIESGTGQVISKRIILH